MFKTEYDYQAKNANRKKAKEAALARGVRKPALREARFRRRQADGAFGTHWCGEAIPARIYNDLVLGTTGTPRPIKGEEQ